MNLAVDNCLGVNAMSANAGEVRGKTYSKSPHRGVVSISVDADYISQNGVSIADIENVIRKAEVATGPVTDHVGQSLKSALRAIAESRGSTCETMLHYLKLAIEAYFNERSPTSANARPLRGGLAPWQVNLAKRLMLEQMDGGVAISSLASACNISRAHFTRSFKRSVGQAPQRWLKECRIERAKELLARGDCSLAEVAVKCGFTDQAHFSRVFKVMTGCTPFGWRSKARYFDDTRGPSSPADGRVACGLTCRQAANVGHLPLPAHVRNPVY